MNTEKIETVTGVVSGHYGANTITIDSNRIASGRFSKSAGKAGTLPLLDKDGVQKKDKAGNLLVANLYETVTQYEVSGEVPLQVLLDSAVAQWVIRGLDFGKEPSVKVAGSKVKILGDVTHDIAVESARKLKSLGINKLANGETLNPDNLFAYAESIKATDIVTYNKIWTAGQAIGDTI